MIWKILLVFLVSMVPLIELRGAIPIAIGMDLGLPEWAVLLIAIVGNILPVPVIYLFARKVLEWGVKCKWKPFKNFCDFVLKKAKRPVINYSKKLNLVFILLCICLWPFQFLAPALGPARSQHQF